MAVTANEVLSLFEQVTALKNSDQFLLVKANANGTVSATKITAELVRAYLNRGFEVTIGDDGYFYIGGERTHVPGFQIVEKTEEQMAAMTPADFSENTLYFVPEEQ